VSAPLVYFDTSVYVSVLLGPEAPGFAESIAAIRAAEHGQYEGLLSALVPAEVTGAPSIRAPQNQPADEATRRLDRAVDFFRRSSFRYVEIGRREGLRAAEIAREWNMKGADALHLAIAEMAGCQQFHTRDRDQLKVGDELPGMIVMEPIGTAQAELNFNPGPSS
jgi:predicted nucleic acid-binding protein